MIRDTKKAISRFRLMALSDAENGKEQPVRLSG